MAFQPNQIIEVSNDGFKNQIVRAEYVATRKDGKVYCWNDSDGSSDCLGWKNARRISEDGGRLEQLQKAKEKSNGGIGNFTTQAKIDELTRINKIIDGWEGVYLKGTEPYNVLKKIQKEIIDELKGTELEVFL